mmetsp:Transcript_40071/g.52495  ORF Transcript_40071/g.52495 Transcript_40071/m.52495 type:complete len:163 (+) Transcript_40071:1679-2167(+)
MSMQNAKMSEQFLASGSFLDAKSSNAQVGGAGTTTSDILFLKRLLFLKAALDNDQTISNFAVPFEEDRAFQLGANEVRPAQLKELTRGVSTAPVTIDGKRPRLDQVPLSLEDNEERPLALTNGGINDDLNDTQQLQMKPLFPSGHQQRLPPRTAAAKLRPNK